MNKISLKLVSVCCALATVSSMLSMMYVNADTASTQSSLIVQNINNTLKITEIKVGYNTIRLDWNEIPEAKNYQVYQKKGSSWSQIATVTGKNYYYVSDLNGGQKYEFKVCCSVNGVNYDTGSKIVFTKLSAPSIKASVINDNTKEKMSVKLTWTNNPKWGSIHDCVVYYKTSGGNWNYYGISVTGNSITVGNLQRNEKYSFKIKLVSSNSIKSDYSNTVSCTMPGELGYLKKRYSSEINSSKRIYNGKNLIITQAERYINNDKHKHYFITHVMVDSTNDVGHSTAYDSWGTTKKKLEHETPVSASKRDKWVLGINASYFDINKKNDGNPLGNIYIRKGKILRGSDNTKCGYGVVALTKYGELFTPDVSTTLKELIDEYHVTDTWRSCQHTLIKDKLIAENPFADDFPYILSKNADGYNKKTSGNTVKLSWDIPSKRFKKYGNTNYLSYTSNGITTKKEINGYHVYAQLNNQWGEWKLIKTITNPNTMSCSFTITKQNDYVAYKVKPYTKLDTVYPRTAIGMASPCNYYIITAGQEKDEGILSRSYGLTLAEEARILKQHGCTYARGLDEGASSSLVFKNKLQNVPANSEDKEGRPVADFLYFVDK